ncbi:DUF3653 domain-containing protein [Photobacterium indicum]|uniref:DUF3653 domain-containing protein n=1 Tax=Photobacterium indicum TaxID=81447 RepID=UPI003D0A067C
MIHNPPVRIMVRYVKRVTYSGLIYCFKNSVQLNNRNQITDNFIFRMYLCKLSIKETAELCFKSVRTVTEWDNGKSIPPECRRLMKLYSGRELSSIDDNWRQWRMAKGELITPSGWGLTPDRIITGNALIEIGAEGDREYMSKIIRTARQLKELPKSRRGN